MGAVTVSIKRTVKGVGSGTAVIADVTFSSSYGAGGDTYTNSQFGLTNIDAIVDQGAAAASATTGLVLSPDLANKKLRLLGMAAAAGVGTALTETNVAGQTGTVQRVLVLDLGPYI